MPGLQRVSASFRFAPITVITGAGGTLGGPRDRNMTGGEMRIWGLKNCDTCRKAVKALEAAGQTLDYVDVRADGVDASDLERFYAAFGEALVNKRSTTWRGLSEGERAGDPVALLAQHPTLMKRPVIEADGALTLGWDAKTQAKWLENGA